MRFYIPEPRLAGIEYGKRVSIACDGWLLFRAHLEHAQCAVPSGKHAVFIREKLSTLSLTPGDYAAIARRMHVLGRTITPESLLDALRSEASYKSGFKKHPVGFV